MISNLYIFVGKMSLQKKMWLYLKEKGYQESEITSMKTYHSYFNKILSYHEWNIAIVYEDEPNSVYFYHLKNGQIIEGGVSGSTPKEELKH